MYEIFLLPKKLFVMQILDSSSIYYQNTYVYYMLNICLLNLPIKKTDTRTYFLQYQLKNSFTLLGHLLQYKRPIICLKTIFHFKTSLTLLVFSVFLLF